MFFGERVQCFWKQPLTDCDLTEAAEVLGKTFEDLEETYAILQTSFIKYPSRALKIELKIGKAAAFKKPNVGLSTLPDNRNFYLSGEELYLKNLFTFIHYNRIIDKLLSTTEFFPSAPIKSATVIEVRLEKSSTVSAALLTTSEEW